MYKVFIVHSSIAFLLFSKQAEKQPKLVLKVQDNKTNKGQMHLEPALTSLELLSKCTALIGLQRVVGSKQQESQKRLPLQLQVRKNYGRIARNNQKTVKPIFYILF